MASVLQLNRLEKSFNKWLHSYKMLVPADYPIKDLRLFSQANKPAIVKTIDREFSELGSVKVNLTFSIHLTKEGANGIERIEQYFRHDNPFPVTDLNQAGHQFSFGKS